MSNGLPRTIWTLWLQGWEEAPELPRTCLRTWQQRNPGWEVRPLDLEALLELVQPPLPLAGKSPAAVSDIARLALLRRYGGVWVDSTVFCAAPLDSWIDEHAREGFFAFSRPAPDRMLASWFLAAEPGHVVPAAWEDATTAYWRGRSEADRYFWVHDRFAEIYRGDPRVRRVWDAVPQLSARGPHYFAPDYEHRLGRRLRAPQRARMLSGSDRVYKLSRHVDLGGAPGSAGELLAEWAREPQRFAEPAPPSRRVAAALAVERAAEPWRWRRHDLRRRLSLWQRRLRGRR